MHTLMTSHLRSVSHIVATLSIHHRVLEDTETGFKVQSIISTRQLISIHEEQTHSWIGDAAGERNTTFLAAAMSPVTTEVDVEIPIVWFLSSTAVVLLHRQSGEHLHLLIYDLQL